METITIDDDIHVFCETATSFPEGVLEAHQKLHGYVPHSTDRKYFGISYPDKTGKIIYKSAAEELEKGELSQHDLEIFTIKKGKYIFTDIPDFMKDIPAIGKAFETLLSNPDIDPTGCCVEWYLNDEVCRCMIRLKD